MQNIYRELQNLIAQIPAEYGIPITLVSILISLLICFVGYRLIKIWIVFSGFFIGAALAAKAANYFWANNQLTIALALIVGIALAVAALKLFEIAVFIVAALFAYMFIGTILLYFNISFNPAVYLLVAVVALIIGGVAVMFIKPAGILITAVYGGMMAGQGILKLLLPQQIPPLLLLVMGFIIAAAGITIQFASCKNVN